MLEIATRVGVDYNWRKAQIFELHRHIRDEVVFITW